jgi:hypothetical protein
MAVPNESAIPFDVLPFKEYPIIIDRYKRGPTLFEDREQRNCNDDI